MAYQIPNHPPTPMKIEAVIVSHNYSDFLQHTLPEALQHIDHIVVVTTPGDKKTRALCSHYSVDCIDTEVFFENGDKFNKGRGVNLGLSHLRHDDWLLHLDADILLPHRFRDMVWRAKLDKSNIYGADRLNVKNYETYIKNQSKLRPQFQHKCLINPVSDFNVGSRLVHNEYGYCPIGYFQLWHSSANRKYPINQGSAEHTDVLFAVQWARKNRILLPEIFVTHLESESAPMGANWRGRQTKPFGK